MGLNSQESTKTLIVVPCADRKIWDIDPFYKGEKVPARYAYVGNYSKACIRYAQKREKSGDIFLILSTKYGFLFPDDLIEDYDEKSFIISDEPLRLQAEKIDVSQIHSIEVVAPEEYYWKVKKAFGTRVLNIAHILSGMNRGEAMGYLKKLRRDFR
jgi:hypothetical protein